MRIKIVPILVVALGIFHNQSAWSDLNSAKTSFNCNDKVTGIEKLRCDTLANRWSAIEAGAAGDLSLDFKKFCVDRVRQIGNCCQAGAAVATCSDGFDDKTKEDLLVLQKESEFFKAGGKPSESGLKAFCGKQEDINSRGANVQSSLLGACQAEMDFCSNHCEAVLRKCEAEPSKCTGLGDIKLAFANSCKADKPSAFPEVRQQVASFSDGSATAKMCGDLAKGDDGLPPPTGPYGDNTKDKVDDGYSFDEGLGSALMSALGSMMGGMGGGQDQGGQAYQDPYYPQTCDQNPNLAHCPDKNDKSWNPENGAELASINDSTQPSDFNVSDIAPPVNPDIVPGQPADPAQVQQVPNGGGGVPGGGAGAGLGGGSGGGGGAAPKSKTDILQGERSGGYSQMAADMKMAADGSGGFSGYGSGSSTTSGNGYKVGMDLKQFLPGGAKDPSRRIAGSGSAREIEIQSAGVNIWERISDRFRNRCAQGLLRDCVP